MSEQVLRYLEQAGVVISLAVVAIIVAGFALASGRYVLRWRDVTLDRNFKQFKVDLAHALTLGLEILVLADVIETITLELTFQSLAVSTKAGTFNSCQNPHHGERYGQFNPILREAYSMRSRQRRGRGS
jgi:uncharacterized membrane protein